MIIDQWERMCILFVLLFCPGLRLIVLLKEMHKDFRMILHCARLLLMSVRDYRRNQIKKEQFLFWFRLICLIFCKRFVHRDSGNIFSNNFFYQFFFLLFFIIILHRVFLIHFCNRMFNRLFYSFGNDIASKRMDNKFVTREKVDTIITTDSWK